MHSSLSELEKNFQTHHTFRRNTRYFDANMMFTQQKFGELSRRKPVNPSQSPKMRNSFTNSTTTLGNKLEHETNKFKHRVSLLDTDLSPRSSEYEKQYSSPSSPKLRTFYIDKMTTRDYQHQLRNKPVEDERQFNNFKFQKPNLNKTCDFSKLKGKSLSFTLKHMNDIYHESKKPYDYCFYKDSTLKTKVSYSLENKNQKRFFFRPKRAEDFAATVMDPEKVGSGLKIASNYKGSNIRQDKIPSFFMQSGREMPCTPDMRQMNEQTNFYKGNDGKIIKPNIDYTIKKMREDLLTKRKEQISKSKQPEFSRNQICDEKYFKMQRVK